MPYCNKCGKEIPNGQHCVDCKTDHSISKIEQNKNTNWILIVGIILIIFVALFLVFKNANVVNEGDFTKSCPYECCKESSGFLVKPCLDLYECKESKCIAVDNDKDGLTDIKEKEIGTNPNNPNSDNDRYNDGVDPNPLISNSAKIDLVFTSKSWDWKYGNILLSMIGGIIIKPDLSIAEPKASIKVINIGDDHTNFVDFNIVFKVSNTIISQKQIHINKFNVGDEFQETYTQQITAGDVPDLLINLVQQQTNNWGIEIQNLNYEKFP